MLQKKKLLALFLKSGMLGIAVTMMTGCQLLPHAVQPSQLRKLNRGPALGRDSYNFSIKDPAIPSRIFHGNEKDLSRSTAEFTHQGQEFEPGDFPANIE